jgi:hypothetical protein
MTFWRVGGDACLYAIGGALIVADDSLYMCINNDPLLLLMGFIYLARFTFPNEIGLPTTTAHVICLLVQR